MSQRVNKLNANNLGDDYGDLIEQDNNAEGKSQKKLKRKGSKKDLPQIDLEDDEFYKKWAGPLILGPFLPAVFALVIIVSGQLVLNTWKGTCGYELQTFISFAIVICYFFLMVYAWVFIGDNIQLKIATLGVDYRVLAPFKSLKWLMGFYCVLFGMSFLVFVVGTVLLNMSVFCADTAPVLYQYTQFLVVIYWVFFAITMVYVVKLFAGSSIVTLLKETTRESTLSEVEEKLFRQKFSEFDTEGENRISRDDMPKLLAALGVYVPEAEQKTLLATFDPDKSGFIRYSVMSDWFRKLNADLDDKLPADADNDSMDTEQQNAGKLFGKK